MKPPRPVFFVSLLAFAVAATAEVVERIVVRVNGDVVTQSEFESRQVAAVQAARVPPERIEGFLRENNARILQEAVDDLLLVQRAADLGIRISDPYITEVIDGIKKENNIATDEDLQRQLSQEGMSLADLKRNIERSILKREVLRRELESKVAVTEADARADYEARKMDYTKLPTVHLYEIVLAAESGALAADLVRRARAGEDFVLLARTHSIGPTRAGGGELGRLSRGDLTAEVEKVAFALPAGGVSDPMAGASGIRILKVMEKTEGHVTAFEEVKDEVTRRLFQTRMTAQYEAYLEGLRKSALVDLRVREVPLQVSVPSSTLLEAPILTAPAVPSAPGADQPAETPKAPAEGSEFSTTPQAAPERVAPPPAQPAPSPAASPSPKPR